MKTPLVEHSSEAPGAVTARPANAAVWVVWLALVAISVAGRLWQPAANVTPLTGAAIAAGSVFSNPLVAASVPVTALAISNLVLPGYGPGLGGLCMAAVVATALSWPVLVGAVFRRSTARAAGRITTLVGGTLASSLVFFFATNFAHWALGNDYPHTATGLFSCFVAGLPFYRWMPLGDLAWTGFFVGGLAALGRLSPALRPLFASPANAA